MTDFPFAPNALSGKIALVTGSSRGIGFATATLLKQAGAEVIVHGTNEAGVRAAAEKLNARGLIANLMQPEAVETLATQAGEVDILVNNAGITRDGLFARQTPEQWHEVLQVNLNAAVRLTHGLLPHMQKQGWGRVVNISSIVNHMGNIGQTNYIAAKAGLTGFTKGLALEIGRKGVTVNCVAPGFVATDMTDKIPEKLKDDFLGKIPAKRFAEPEEIAAAVAFLATPAANYITGNTLHVNGGMFVGS